MINEFITDVLLPVWWPVFFVCLLGFLLTALWMQVVAKQFFIQARNFRFSIFDLEFPVSEHSLEAMIKLMGKSERAVVRRHLLIDFLFMPFAYIGVALLCIKTASKMQYIGHYVFIVLALLQVVPWLFDVLENFYLMGKLKNTVKPQAVPDINSGAFKRYQFFVRVKFGVALTGAVCSLFGLLYFWIKGDYQKETLVYLGGVVLLILLFSFIGKAASKEPVPAEA